MHVVSKNVIQATMDDRIFEFPSNPGVVVLIPESVNNVDGKVSQHHEWEHQVSCVVDRGALFNADDLVLTS